MGKRKDSIAYSLAVDKSSDASDTAQLSIFIKSMHGTTTGEDLFEEVSKSVNEMGLPWDKLVGLTTDVQKREA